MDIKPAGKTADWQTPVIKDYGDLAEVTAQGATGSRADANLRIGQTATFISS